MHLIFPKLVHFWCFRRSKHNSLLAKITFSVRKGYGTRSSLFWCISGAHSRDQITPLLAYIWRQQSGPDHSSSSVLYFCPQSGQDHPSSTVLCFCWQSGPDHPSSGVLLPAVGTRSSLFWLTRSSLFLVYLWSQQLGTDQSCSGVPRKLSVGSRSSPFWCTSNAYHWDQIIHLLVYLWILQSETDHPSAGGSLEAKVGTRITLSLWASGTHGQDQIINLLMCL